jgi:hypothetical protein
MPHFPCLESLKPPCGHRHRSNIERDTEVPWRQLSRQLTSLTALHFFPPVSPAGGAHGIGDQVQAVLPTLIAFHLDGFAMLSGLLGIDPDCPDDAAALAAALDDDSASDGDNDRDDLDSSSDDEAAAGGRHSGLPHGASGRRARAVAASAAAAAEAAAGSPAGNGSPGRGGGGGSPGAPLAGRLRSLMIQQTSSWGERGVRLLRRFSRLETVGDR